MTEAAVKVRHLIQVNSVGVATVLEFPLKWEGVVRGLEDLRHALTNQQNGSE